MMDLQKEFDALPAAVADPADAAAARHVWLRARLASIVTEEDGVRRLQRLRAVSAMMAILALDVIVPLVLSSAAIPFAAVVTAVVLVHSAASLALLRA